MEVRQMSTAFLFHDGQVLMMRKSGSRLYDGEFWTGLGGHMEPEELNEPKIACYREIEEESGLQESDIEELRLRYVLLRIKDGEIRQQFVYFGQAMRRSFTPSDEGELFWVDEQELLRLRTSRIIGFMLEHYAQHRDMEQVMVGTIAADEQQEPYMQWAALKDPGIF